jgi:hypothetical protein
MTFDDIKGGATIHADSEKLTKIKNHVNEEFRNEDENDLAVSRIVDLAVAVGLEEGKRSEHSLDGADRTSIGSLDPQNVLKTLIEIKHPDKSGEDLVTLLREYYAGGVDVIVNDISNHDHFDYNRYLCDENDTL